MGEGQGRRKLANQGWGLGEGRAAGRAHPRPCKAPRHWGISAVSDGRRALSHLSEPLEPGPEPVRFWAPHIWILHEARKELR